MLGCDKRLPSVLIGYIWSVVLYPVGDETTHLVRNGDYPLAVVSVLQTGPCVWSVTESKCSPVFVKVTHIKGVKCSSSHGCLPQQAEDKVLARGILEAVEVGQYLLGTVGFKHHVSHALSVLQRR